MSDADDTLQDIAGIETAALVRQRLFDVQSRLAARLGIEPPSWQAYLHGRIERMILTAQLPEDDLVLEWHAAYAAYQDWLHEDPNCFAALPPEPPMTHHRLPIYQHELPPEVNQLPATHPDLSPTPLVDPAQQFNRSTAPSAPTLVPAPEDVRVWACEVTRRDGHLPTHSYRRLFMTEELAWEYASTQVRSYFMPQSIHRREGSFVDQILKLIESRKFREAVELFSSKYSALWFTVNEEFVFAVGDAEARLQALNIAKWAAEDAAEAEAVKRGEHP